MEHRTRGISTRSCNHASQLRLAVCFGCLSPFLPVLSLDSAIPLPIGRGTNGMSFSRAVGAGEWGRRASEHRTDLDEILQSCLPMQSFVRLSRNPVPSQPTAAPPPASQTTWNHGMSLSRELLGLLGRAWPPTSGIVRSRRDIAIPPANAVLGDVFAQPCPVTTCSGPAPRFPSDVEPWDESFS